MTNGRIKNIFLGHGTAENIGKPRKFPARVEKRHDKRRKKILDGIEPADKKTTVNPGEKISLSDYQKNPLVVTMEDVEHLKFIDRMMVLPGIESGYVKIEGGSSYVTPPEYIVKIGGPLNAVPSTATENKEKE